MQHQGEWNNRGHDFPDAVSVLVTALRIFQDGVGFFACSASRRVKIAILDFVTIVALCALVTEGYLHARGSEPIVAVVQPEYYWTRVATGAY